MLYVRSSLLPLLAFPFLGMHIARMRYYGMRKIHLEQAQTLNATWLWPLIQREREREHTVNNQHSMCCSTVWEVSPMLSLNYVYAMPQVSTTSTAKSSVIGNLLPLSLTLWMCKIFNNILSSLSIHPSIHLVNEQQTANIVCQMNE